MTDTDGYLTVPMVAKILHVSQCWVYKMVEEGDLLCRRIGKGKRMIRFHPKDIDKWMDSHKTGKAGK